MEHRVIGCDYLGSWGGLIIFSAFKFGVSGDFGYESTGVGGTGCRS